MAGRRPIKLEFIRPEHVDGSRAKELTAEETEGYHSGFTMIELAHGVEISKENVSAQLIPWHLIRRVHYAG